LPGAGADSAATGKIDLKVNSFQPAELCGFSHSSPILNRFFRTFLPSLAFNTPVMADQMTVINGRSQP
jgi:hypothetical protein